MARPTNQQQMLEQERRARVCRLYLKGNRMLDIAELLGISISTVGRDLQFVREEWRAQRLDDMATMLNVQLDRIDLLEKTSWDAWESSRKPKRITTRTSEVVPERDPTLGKAELIQTDEVVRIERRDGDPRFLDKVAWCISERCKILGLYAPEKHAITNPKGDREAQFIREALKNNDTREILATLSDRLGGLAGGLAGTLESGGAGGGGHAGTLANGTTPEPAQPLPPHGGNGKH